MPSPAFRHSRRNCTIYSALVENHVLRYTSMFMVRIVPSCRLPALAFAIRPLFLSICVYTEARLCERAGRRKLLQVSDIGVRCRLRTLDALHLVSNEAASLQIRSMISSALSKSRSVQQPYMLLLFAIPGRPLTAVNILLTNIPHILHLLVRMILGVFGIITDEESIHDETAHYKCSGPEDAKKDD
jgi:hypothetical protein